MQSVSQNTAVAKSSVAPSYQLRFMPPVFILVLLECATEETIISGVLDRSVDIIIKIKIVKEGRKTNVGRFVYGICDAIIAEKPRDSTDALKRAQRRLPRLGADKKSAKSIGTIRVHLSSSSSVVVVEAVWGKPVVKHELSRV